MLGRAAHDRGNQKLAGFRAGFHDGVHVVCGIAEVGQLDPGRGLHARKLHRADDGFRDGTEDALGADEQALKDVHGFVFIEEGINSQSIGVANRELSAQELHHLGVGAQLIAEGQQIGVELRLLLAEGLVSTGRIHDGAGRQDEDQLFDAVVAIAFQGAAHAAGVIGQHATDGAHGRGTRVRPQHEAMAGEYCLGIAQDDAGARPQLAAFFAHFHAAEVGLDIDEDVIAHGLAVQGRSCCAEGHVATVRIAVLHERSEVRCVARGNHHVRDGSVGAGIGGEAHEIAETSVHVFCADDGFHVRNQLGGGAVAVALGNGVGLAGSAGRA